MDIGKLTNPDSPTRKNIAKSVEHRFTDSETGDEVIEVVEFTVKNLTFGDHLDMHKHIEAGVNQGVALISAAVLCDGGKTKLTPEQVESLPPELIPLILAEVEEVNQLQKKSLLLTKNSSTASSSQESAEEQ